MTIEEVLIIYLPAIIFSFLWLRIKNQVNRKIFTITCSITIIIFMMIYGFFAADRFTEISAIGNSFLFSSSLWLIGPTLFVLDEKIKNNPKEKLVLLALVIILPPLGFMTGIISMLLTNQISGF